MPIRFTTWLLPATIRATEAGPGSQGSSTIWPTAPMGLRNMARLGSREGTLIVAPSSASRFTT